LQLQHACREREQHEKANRWRASMDGPRDAIARRTAAPTEGRREIDTARRPG
jgi:hypothetical protein